MSEAQHRAEGRPTVVGGVIIVVRDPDASNTYQMFGVQTRIIEFDLGDANLENPEEWREFALFHRDEAEQLRASGYPDAAHEVLSLIEQYAEEYGHDGT